VRGIHERLLFFYEICCGKEWRAYDLPDSQRCVIEMAENY
jgi:hypothetical protein